MFDDLDIFKYPDTISDLERRLNSTRDQRDAVNAQLDRQKTFITAEVDKEKFKSNEIRTNFINLSLYNNEEYGKMCTELNQLESQVRDMNADMAVLRRKYRLLENEYQASGVRKYSQILNAGK